MKFFHDTLFCIEDPLEPFLNFSRHVSQKTLPTILGEFQRAEKIVDQFEKKSVDFGIEALF